MLHFRRPLRVFFAYGTMGTLVIVRPKYPYVYEKIFIRNFIIIHITSYYTSGDCRY